MSKDKDRFYICNQWYAINAQFSKLLGTKWGMWHKQITAGDDGPKFGRALGLAHGK